MKKAESRCLCSRKNLKSKLLRETRNRKGSKETSPVDKEEAAAAEAMKAVAVSENSNLKPPADSRKA